VKPIPCPLCHKHISRARGRRHMREHHTKVYYLLLKLEIAIEEDWW
jgi:hypothetical protein